MSKTKLPTLENWQFILRLLRLTRVAEVEAELYWQVNPENVPEFFFNVNDIFHWGTADTENITPDNIDDFEQAFNDVNMADEELGSIYVVELFAARQRKMRPQTCIYDTLPEKLHPLFDECGPPRPVSVGNGVSKKYPERNIKAEQ